MPLSGHFSVWVPTHFPEVICPRYGPGIINFEINLTFLIKSFFYMTEKSRQKIKYLQNERNF